MLNQLSKIIEQYDKNDNYLRTFTSITQAAAWLFENNYTTNTSEGSIRVKLANVAKGKAKTAYKFKWKFIE